MSRSPLSEVDPELCVYDLDKVFNAAVSEHKALQQDAKRSYEAGHEFGVSWNVCKTSRAAKVVEALQAFKDAGKTHVVTKYPLATNLLQPGVQNSLYDQLKEKKAYGVKMDVSPF